MSSNYLTSSGPRTAPHSERADIYYSEKYRVQVNGGWVGYVISKDKESYRWNIPITSTTVLMLRMGTSVTQAAMREFAHIGMMVGFCGMDGVPLYSANEVDVDVFRSSPQSEHCLTKYLQQWVSLQFVGVKRSATAKRFQLTRLIHTEKHWTSTEVQREHALQPGVNALHILPDRTRKEADVAENHTQFMLVEAKLTKALYRMVS